MPKSKKRKKDGKVVNGSPEHRLGRFEEQESGVTLQDLINVAAYQEYRAQGLIDENGLATTTSSVQDTDLDVISHIHGDDLTVAHSEEKEQD